MKSYLFVNKYDKKKNRFDICSIIHTRMVFVTIYEFNPIQIVLYTIDNNVLFGQSIHHGYHVQ